MRDKNLLQLFLILNVALTACFVVYLFLSSNNQPKVTSTSFVTAPTRTNSGAKLLAEPVRTNLANVASTLVAEIATNTAGVSNPPAPKAVLTQKKFGWEQIQKDEES